MKIAYVSYEYPPDTAVGGIATYVKQAAELMNSRGHHVEVFCMSSEREISEDLNGIKVHRIKHTDRFKFRDDIVPVFGERHEKVSFDIVESPEFNADGLGIKRYYPRLPLVVKLHTPWFLIHKLDFHYDTSFKKIKFMLGGVLKGKMRRPYWKFKKKELDTDYHITCLADQIHTPSVSLGNIVSREWSIDRKKILNVPYPFIPDEKFLKVPLSTENKTVTFLGRLEIRKGLTELVKAIPAVLDKHPLVKVRFIGKTQESIKRGELMRDYIKRKLKKYNGNIEFLELQPEEIVNALAQTDVCVFPSVWENFPNVCLEAMSAGRAIVGGNQGGMKDMLEEPAAGILVDPLNAKEISDGINALLENSELRTKLGKTAREVILKRYNQEVIGTLMEGLYNMAINKRLLNESKILS